MTHHQIPVVCSPDEFMRTTPRGRRRLVRRQIDLTPEMHNQGCWINLTEESEKILDDETIPKEKRNLCGTAFCFAGWASHLAGDRFIDDEEIRTPAGRRMTVSQRAIELLGLPVPAFGDPKYYLPDLFGPEISLGRIDQLLDELDREEDAT